MRPQNNHRMSQNGRLLAMFVVTSLLFLASSSVSASPNAFYYPCPDDGGYLQWEYKTSSGTYHLGDDRNASAGTPVVAIADGEIVWASSNISGFLAYNPALNGGAIVIRHEYAGINGTAVPFFALYGHVANFRKTSGTVVAGEHIADIGPFYRDGSPVSPGTRLTQPFQYEIKQGGQTYHYQNYYPHLHFGIYTGSVAPRSLLGYASSTGEWVDPIPFLSSHLPATSDSGSSTPPPGIRTATVLVMDTSGSMGERWQGGRKIDSAKDAALQFISHVEQENLTQGTEHWIGVVGFSGDARVLLSLTNNYAQAKRVIISMSASSATNLGAGLTIGLQEVARLPGQAQRYVTILSDGNTNTGLSESQILSGPVIQARQAKICINTVGFGNKSSIDEEFLRRIATQSGCGRYEYAASGFDLFAAYIKIRHHALGQVISGLSSFGSRVTPTLGRTIPLGTISIPSGQRELQITLGWSEAGRLQLKLYDPTGRQVTSSYPGAQLYSSGQFAHAIVTSPLQGFWRVDALPSTSMSGGTEYFAIGSTRPGGIAFALPLPVFAIGDTTISLPGNMPTWALVLVSIACLAIGLWQVLVDAGLL